MTISRAFGYWVNVYESHIDMGGSTREEADTNAEFMSAEFRRMDCRLLRYIPGKGLRDVTLKSGKTRKTHNVPPEVRAAASERMKRLWAEGKMQRSRVLGESVE